MPPGEGTAYFTAFTAGFTREYPDNKVELTTDDFLVDIVQQGFERWRST